MTDKKDEKAQKPDAGTTPTADTTPLGDEDLAKISGGMAVFTTDTGVPNFEGES